jgi:hypothetical protein
MTKLDEMWAALENYQKYADADGHGDTWAEMCELKTEDAAWDAAGAAAIAVAVVYVSHAVYDASYAVARLITAAAAESVYDVDFWPQFAIDRINDAILNKENKK